MKTFRFAPPRRPCSLVSPGVAVVAFPGASSRHSARHADARRRRCSATWPGEHAPPPCRLPATRADPSARSETEVRTRGASREALGVPHGCVSRSLMVRADTVAAPHRRAAPPRSHVAPSPGAWPTLARRAPWPSCMSSFFFAVIGDNSLTCCRPRSSTRCFVC